MVTNEKQRNRILNKVKKLSDDKLTNLEAYINELDTELSSEAPTMSYSGIFKDLDIDELTSDLHHRRTDTDQRIPLF